MELGSTNMPEVTRYHPVLVALHWLLAFLIIAALALGALVMARLPNSDPMKLEALRSHMAGGVLIFALMLTRLLMRTHTAHPPAATTGNPLGWHGRRTACCTV
jgi:cytochrome b561